MPGLFTRIIYYLRLIVFYLFNKPFFNRLKFKSFIERPLRIDGRQWISIGKSAIVKKHSWLIAIKSDDAEPELVIGDGCSIGYFNHIAAVKKVVLGNNVLTANNVYISDNIHEYENIEVPIMNQAVRFKSEVSIGDGTWIGENACVIGAKIGRNCVIGANAVVTKDVDDYCVAVGSPARVIKRYDPVSEKWQTVL